MRWVSSSNLGSVPALNEACLSDTASCQLPPSPSLPRAASVLPFVVALSTKVPGKGCVGCDSVMCSQEQREQSRERMEEALTDPEVMERPPLPTQEICEVPPPPTPHTSTQKALGPSFFNSPFPQVCTHTHIPPERIAGRGWKEAASTCKVNFFPQSR